MTFQTQLTGEELRKVFADTLDKGSSRSLIMVSYRENGKIRTEVSVPYSVHEEEKVIRVGPYLKDLITSKPSDLHNREKLIFIPNIIGYRRIELSDIL